MGDGWWRDVYNSGIGLFDVAVFEAGSVMADGKGGRAVTIFPGLEGLWSLECRLIWYG